MNPSLNPSDNKRKRQPIVHREDPEDLDSDGFESDEYDYESDEYDSDDEYDPRKPLAKLAKTAKSNKAATATLKKTCHITKLPTELIEHIARFCDAKGLLSLLTSNAEFRVLFRDGAFWTNLQRTSHCIRRSPNLSAICPIRFMLVKAAKGCMICGHGTGGRGKVHWRFMIRCCTSCFIDRMETYTSLGKAKRRTVLEWVPSTTRYFRKARSSFTCYWDRDVFPALEQFKIDRKKPDWGNIKKRLVKANDEFEEACDFLERNKV
ncbi:hypothetical protein HDU98_004747 [Podochytrium sp. JEL0797]|nr:hypothetical protein HDU98_004747 [Podochytrium sp. JEL0797]